MFGSLHVVTRCFLKLRVQYVANPPKHADARYTLFGTADTKLFQHLRGITTMRRCALFSTAATSFPTIVAGCISSGGFSGSNAVAEAATARLELTTITDAKLPTKVLYTVRSAEGDDTTAQLFDRILDGGATTKATRPPLPEQQHTAYQEGVYELSYDVIEETPAIIKTNPTLSVFPDLT